MVNASLHSHSERSLRLVRARGIPSRCWPTEPSPVGAATRAASAMSQAILGQSRRSARAGATHSRSRPTELSHTGGKANQSGPRSQADSELSPRSVRDNGTRSRSRRTEPSFAGARHIRASPRARVISQAISGPSQQSALAKDSQSRCSPMERWCAGESIVISSAMCQRNLDALAQSAQEKRMSSRSRLTEQWCAGATTRVASAMSQVISAHASQSVRATRTPLRSRPTELSRAGDAATCGNHRLRDARLESSRRSARATTTLSGCLQTPMVQQGSCAGAIAAIANAPCRAISRMWRPSALATLTPWCSRTMELSRVGEAPSTVSASCQVRFEW